jgi:diguanylate cyclase (GGDEF)-like protein
VARRVFAILVLAALAPFAVLAGLTATQFQNENARVEKRQLHSSAKAVGTTLFGMLEGADATLRYLAQIAAPVRNRIFQEVPRRWFSAYSDIDGTGRAISNSSELPAVPTKMLSRLLLGDTALFAGTGKDSNRLFMAVPTVGAPPGVMGIVGALDLRDFESLGSDGAVLCLLTESNVPLLCDPSVPESVVGSAEKGDASDNFKSVSWMSSETRWHGGIWPVYTERRFGLRALKLLVAVPASVSAAQQSQFYRSIPPVIGLTLLLVVFISIRLIRQLLRPLDRLTTATQALATGDFAARVRVRTGDEFEDLAGSFNSMATNLNHQFQMLETVAEVDRIVLVAKGTGEILDVLLKRMPKVATCDVAAVVLLDGDRIKDARCEGVFRLEDDGPVIRAKHLDAAVMEVLQQCDHHVIVSESSGFTFLQRVFVDGVECVVCLPVRQQQEITAVICLGYLDATAATELAIQRARALADHAALVFSNAAWEEKLYQQAHFDALTNLPNRQLFTTRLDDAIISANRHGHRVALLYIDLDRFKNLNDLLGHTAGDDYLVRVAAMMQKCLGPDDTLVRLGGDEFTVILPNIENEQRVLEASQIIAERLRASFLNPITIHGQSIALTASIGIAIYPTDASNRMELVRCADQAMYHAKESGRNTWAYYSEKINKSALERLELTAALSGALERGELFLALQPKVDSKTRHLRGAEVLLRWRHPQWGIVSPLQFIPIAEQTGLITPIGMWVIEQACIYLARRRENKQGFFAMSINVSAVQLRQADFLDSVVRILLRHDIDPRLIEFEVTESLCVSDVQGAASMLAKIRERGMRIAIDDFGTGFSSMNYLRHLAIDTIKIDQSFLRGVPDDPFNMAITRAVSSMAHCMGFSVVAEGVETEAQLAHVCGLGCEESQGYLIAKPLPLQEFDAWLASHEQSLQALAEEAEDKLTITAISAARNARR